MISQLKYFIFLFFLLNVLIGFSQNDIVHKEINKIKISTSNDSITFNKLSQKWVSESIKNVNQELLNLVIKRLSKHTLTPIQGDYSSYVVGKIDFVNDSTNYSYLVIKYGNQNKTIIGYNQSYFSLYRQGIIGNILIGLVNTDKWSWTELKPSAGINDIKKIKFKSKFYTNYCSKKSSLFEYFKSLKYHSHIEKDKVQKGKKIGIMTVKYKEGKKKIVYYQKIILDNNIDLNKFYILIDNEYFECDYYHFNTLFNYKK
jgi:hypothetical protein